jgi:hypothetical protein
MPKILKIAGVSLGVLVLGGTVAMAQTPPPNSGSGQTPTSTQAKPHKGSKKSGHKKATSKKKKAKKPAQ